MSRGLANVIFTFTRFIINKLIFNLFRKVQSVTLEVLPNYLTTFLQRRQVN